MQGLEVSRRVLEEVGGGETAPYLRTRISRGKYVLFYADESVARRCNFTAVASQTRGNAFFRLSEFRAGPRFYSKHRHCFAWKGINK